MGPDGLNKRPSVRREEPNGIEPVDWSLKLKLDQPDLGVWGREGGREGGGGGGG